MEDYLEIGDRAYNIKNPKDRLLYRFFEILPGAISFLTLILALLLSWLKPVWVAIFVIIFSLYWTAKTIYFTICQSFCFKRMKDYLKVDWQEKIKKFPDWENIYQLIIFPVAFEGWDIVRDSLAALKNNSYPKKRMIVVLAQEERAGEQAKEIIRKAHKLYDGVFFKFLTVLHPANIEGEVVGKGSNVAFAFNKVKKIIDQEKIPYENILVSSFDVDTKIFNQYFFRLAYQYLESNKPQQVSFQPIPIYHNNIWQAPSFSRVIAASNSFWQMMQQERPEQLVTYSSHSMPFRLLAEVGYPKNVVADDSHIFWKSFLKYNGNYRVIPLYYPISMDVVDAPTFWRSVVNQYKQQRRWAWGCVEIPYMLYGFLKNKKIPLSKKIFFILVTFEGFWSWACASILLFILGWLPTFVGGKNFQITILSYNLPRLTSAILSFASVGMIFAALLNVLFLPPKPRRESFFKNFSMAFQWLLLPLVLIVFGSFPSLDAQFRLMTGKYLGFWNTPKARTYSK